MVVERAEAEREEWPAWWREVGAGPRFVAVMAVVAGLVVVAAAFLVEERDFRVWGPFLLRLPLAVERDCGCGAGPGS